MIEIEAVDLFVEKDPENGDDDEGESLISLRAPNDREFSREIKELGAKWVDAAKEWQLVGNETTIKQISALCKASFPNLPRRRNRLVVSQVSTSEGTRWAGNQDKALAPLRQSQVEVIAEVEFVVNRTIKNFRRGQNLKWSKEFRQIFEQPEATADSGSSTQKKPVADSQEIQDRFVQQIQVEIRDLERVATEAFEALLLGRKDAAASVLNEGGIKQK